MTSPSSPVLFIYMRLWQILGLCPITLSRNFNKCENLNIQQLWYQRYISYPLIWSSLQMLLLTILHVHTCSNYKNLIWFGDNFGKFNDILKLLSSIVAYTITLGECIWRRQEIVDFFQLLMKLQSHCRGSNYTRRNWKLSYQRMHKYFLVGLLVMLIAEGIYTWEMRQRTQWLKFFMGFMPSLTICRLRVMQNVCNLELLRVEIEHLNFEVCRLHPADSIDVHNNQRQQLNLQRLVIIYQQIYRMSKLLCKGTSFSLVAIYVTSYIKLLSDCYWNYWMIYNGVHVFGPLCNHYVFAESVLIVATIVNITFLLVSSRNCMRTAEILVHNVHKIRIPVDNLIMARRLQHFGLLLRHQPIIYDAYGFFIVNCSLISAMLTSITTYMLFFVQFMPKSTNINNVAQTLSDYYK